MSPRPTCAFLALAALGFAADAPPPVSAEARSALSRISADSLRGHVSFLASDLLEGRGTPSRGQDIAAEYIAAQFRRAGLQPPIDNGYFQVARYLTVEPNRDGLHLELTGHAAVDPAKIAIDTAIALTLENVDAVKFGPDIAADGKVVFVHAVDFRQVASARTKLASQKPALVILTGPYTARPARRRGLTTPEDRARAIATIAVDNEALAAEIESATPGALPFKVSAKMTAPAEKEVLLKNVIGVLPGSDPVLKETCVLMTAHYDHLGKRATGDDRIFNGANDDASGVASIIEIASTLAAMQPRPKRTLVFLAVYGEEIGLVGSRYYGKHPVFPLAKTVADVNLEHMGRTDADVGPHVAFVNFTGFTFSDVPAIFKRAGEAVGVQVVRDEQNSDAYFGRSDNQALADIGIPAHTASVSYEFPDYHQPGDHWEKLDYDNMALVDRMLTLGAIMIADNPQPPKWNEAEPKAQRYVDAWRKLNGEAAPQ